MLPGFRPARQSLCRDRLDAAITEATTHVLREQPLPVDISTFGDFLIHRMADHTCRGRPRHRLRPNPTHDSTIQITISTGCAVNTATYPVRFGHMYDPE